MCELSFSLSVTRYVTQQFYLDDIQGKGVENPLLVSTVLYSSKTREEIMKMTLAVCMDDFFFWTASSSRASGRSYIYSSWTADERRVNTILNLQVPSKEVKTNAVKDGKQTQT